MSYTNGTTHYNLPLTTGADKRDWSDTNQAFSDVDAALYGAVQDTAQAELDIDALETRMDTAEQNISTNTGNIAGLDTRVTTVEGAITSLSGQVTDTRQDLEDMICAYNEASATSTHRYEIGDYFIYNDVLYKATQAIALGDTIVPDTNCATTNVTTELLATEDLSDDVQQLQTDVNAVQDDIADLKYTLIRTDDTTDTWGNKLKRLLKGITFDITHYDYFILNNDQEIIRLTEAFTSGDVYFSVTRNLIESGTFMQRVVEMGYLASTDTGMYLLSSTEIAPNTPGTPVFSGSSGTTITTSSVLKLYSAKIAD